MADSWDSESDFFMESYWTSPGTQKRKKKSKNKKAKKSKCDMTFTQDDGIRQKSNPEFEEATTERKEVRKKKRRKKRSIFGIDGGFIFTQASAASLAQQMSPGQNSKKSESDTTLTQNDGIRRKRQKKNPGFQEAMKERKGEKKKKKKRVTLGIDDHFIVTQARAASDPHAQWMSPGQIPVTTPAVFSQQSPQQPETSQATSESTPQKKKRKKSKPQKRVSFELSPGYNRIRVQSTFSPEVVLPFAQSAPAKDLSPLQNQGVGDRETLPQATKIEECSGQTQDNDSQCTGDDSYSQDLFITQKKFRPPSSLEPSSGETNSGEEVAVTTRQQDTESYKNVLPREKQRAELTQEVEEQNTPPTQHQKESHSHLRDPQGEACNKLTHFPQQPRKANAYMQEPMEIHSHLAEESKGSHGAHLKGKDVNPCLEQPMEANALSGVTKQPKESHTPRVKATRPTCGRHTSKLLKPSPFPLRLTADTSTQTENHFTTELSSYLRFHQQSRAALSSADLDPLDLSLPQRTRAEILSCSAKSSAVEDRDGDGKPGEQHPSSSLILITDDDGDPSQRLLSEVKIKEEKSDGQHPLSSTPNVRDDTTPNLQSEAETKSTDTTSSSEDTELGVRSGRLDLIQVRAVQTRLNESFFFKMKRDGPSPRPRSPLMKLAQGREMRSKKRH